MKLTLNHPLWFFSLLGLGIAIPLSYLKFFCEKKKKITSTVTIIADIGGTNSRFQVVGIDATMQKPKVYFKKTYSTQNYDNFTDLFHQFLKDSKADSPHFPNNAVLAVAGPVRNGTVTASNIKKWGELNGYSIKNEFNLENCVFLNDFEAIGYAIIKLEKQDFFQINEEARAEEDQKIAVMGPGTGLGYCTMVPAPFHKGNRYYVWGGEGGHAAFSPVTQEHSDYMFWLM